MGGVLARIFHQARSGPREALRMGARHYFMRRYNYADLPLWDVVFGTFQNPRHLDDLACGFYKGAADRIFDMLLGRDVSTPEPEASPMPDDALPGTPWRRAVETTLRHVSPPKGVGGQWAS